MQGRGGAAGCSGAKQALAKPPAAKPAAAKGDYSRPRQTMADQAPMISAVLPASLMHLLYHLIISYHHIMIQLNMST